MYSVEIIGWIFWELAVGRAGEESEATEKPFIWLPKNIAGTGKVLY